MANMVIVIGISGKKRAGKDTVAQMIKEKALASGFTVVRRALADLLKEECAKAIAEEADHYDLSYENILKEMNTDGVKERYRLLLQWWGTEFRRQMCSEDYWVRAMRLWIECHTVSDEMTQPGYPSPKQMILIPDIRFPNEVEMVKQLGGLVLRIQRPMTDFEAGNHPSECALDNFKDWDGIIKNGGNLETLQRQVLLWAENKNGLKL